MPCFTDMERSHFSKKKKKKAVWQFVRYKVEYKVKMRVRDRETEKY